jgi:hypothetical protein
VTGHDRAVGGRHISQREGLGDEDPQRPVLGKARQFQPRGGTDLGARIRAGAAAEKLDASLRGARTPRRDRRCARCT